MGFSDVREPDNTVSAASTAIKDVVKDEGDDYFVIVISDANIQQYNITPTAISKVLKSDDRVNAHMIFIGSLGGSAEKMQKTMGSGAHVCLDSKDVSSRSSLLHQHLADVVDPRSSCRGF